MQKHLFVCALLLLAFTASAQGVTSTTSDHITARQRLRIGTDTSKYFTSIITAFPGTQTHRQLPSALAVRNFIAAWPLTGDLTGTLSAPVVDGLQGRPVAATAPSSGQVLKWDGSSWGPAADGGTTYTGGTGISVAGTIITNTAPDQTVSLTNGGGVSVSGTYPAFTLTATDTSATNELQTLSVASNTATLSNSGGSVTIAGGGINSVSTAGSTITVTATEVDGSITNEIELPSQTGNAGRYLTTNGTTPSWGPISGTGTVTSVGLSLPAQFSVSGSPVTTSGTLTAAWANQSPNLVFAGPASGGAAVPGFRGLVAADLAGTGAVTGSGASGRVAYYSGASTLTSSSTLITDGSRLAVGTNSYDVALTIHDAASSHRNGLVLRNSTTSGYSPSIFMQPYGYIESAYYDAIELRSRYEGGNGSRFAIMRKAQPSSTAVEAFTVFGSGVGIFTPTPTVALDVTGAIKSSGNYTNPLCAVNADGSITGRRIALSGNTTANYDADVYGDKGIKVTTGNYGAIPNPGSYYVGGAVLDARGFTFNTDGVTNTTSPSLGIALAIGRADPGVVLKNTVGRALLIEAGGAQIQGPGATSGTYSLIATNSSGSTATAPLAVRDDGQVGIGTNTPARVLHVVGNMRLTGSAGTPTALMGRDASSDIGAVTIGSGLSLSSGVLSATAGTDTHFGNTNLTISAARTHSFGNNAVTFDASGASIATSTPLIIRGKADGTNSTQFLTIQNAGGSPLFSGTTTNTTTTLEVASGSKLRAGAGALYTAFTDEGSIELHQRSTDASSTQAGELWWNDTSERIRIRNSAQAESVSTYETDIKGSEAFITASTSVLQGANRFVQADANTNSITLTAGAALIEGQVYTIRCRRNNVNPITISADTANGFSLGIDGDSALTPSTYTCTNYEVVHLRRYGSVILVDK